MKTCTKCKETKSLDSYSTNKTCRDNKQASCKACVKIYNEANKANKAIKMKAYRLARKEEIRLYNLKYNTINRDKKNAHNREYSKNNKPMNKAKSAKYRASKLNATLSGHDEELKEIYKNCPEGLEVDHIIPLQNKVVCGLHVPWNLQYLTVEANRSKSNKLLL